MKHLTKDSLLVLVSILLAIIISRLDLIEKFLLLSENVRIVGSFVGGLFFTSIFTTAPAIVFLGEISQIEPILIVALIGAIGSVCGDMLIFYLFRNHVSKDLHEILNLVKNNPFKILFKNGYFQWHSILVGAITIASPLPDELGIALLGISKLKSKSFVLISFTFNFIGILLIGLTSRLLV